MGFPYLLNHRTTEADALLRKISIKASDFYFASYRSYWLLGTEFLPALDQLRDTVQRTIECGMHGEAVPQQDLDDARSALISTIQGQVQLGKSSHIGAIQKEKTEYFLWDDDVPDIVREARGNKFIDRMVEYRTHGPL